MIPINPKWVVIGTAALLICGQAAYIRHQHQVIRTLEQRRELDRLATNLETTEAYAEALGARIEVTKKLEAKERKVTEQALERNAKADGSVDTYRKQLDAARKADPSLDGPLPDATVKRLRDFEAANRLRTERNHQD